MRSRPKLPRKAIEVVLILVIAAALLAIGGTGLPEAVSLAIVFGVAIWTTLKGDSGRCGDWRPPFLRRRDGRS